MQSYTNFLTYQTFSEKDNPYSRTKAIRLIRFIRRPASSFPPCPEMSLGLGPDQIEPMARHFGRSAFDSFDSFDWHQKAQVRGQNSTQKSLVKKSQQQVAIRNLGWSSPVKTAPAKLRSTFAVASLNPRSLGRRKGEAEKSLLGSLCNPLPKMPNSSQNNTAKKTQSRMNRTSRMCGRFTSLNLASHSCTSKADTKLDKNNRIKKIA